MTHADEPVDRRDPRTRRFRRARVAIVALVIGYFFLPYGIRAWIPVWLPFLGALALEAQFFVGGYLAARDGRPRLPSTHDRGPQPHDLDELGGDEWRDLYGFDAEDGIELVPAAELEDDDAEAPTVGRQAPPPRLAAPSRWYVRHLPEAAFAIALVAGILFFAIRPHGWTAISKSDRTRAEARFSQEASAIAGHPARVVCDTSGRHVGLVQEADGVATVGGNLTYIVPDLCDTLYQLAFKHRVQSFSRTGRAIAVLAHESWHLHGVSDEGLANCYAFQSGVTVGVDLGLSESRARSMMRAQLATNAADSGAATQYLVPSGCSNGGRYDLHPASNAFP